MSIIDKFNEYVKEHDSEPKYAEVTVKWLDNNEVCDGYIISLTDFNEADDDRIFYYCDTIADLASLTKKGVEDFVIIPELVTFLGEL